MAYYAADEAAALDYDYAANPNTGYVEGGSPVTSAPATGYNTTPTEATQEAAAAAAPATPATINASASGETAAQIAADLASLPSLDTLSNDVTTGDTTASNIENTLAPNGIPAYVAAQTTPTGETAAQSAFDQFEQMFANAGLSSLVTPLIGMVSSPDAPTTEAGWYQYLQTTPTYIQDFGNVNAQRTQNGYSQLSEAQILNTRNQMTDVMKQQGLPAGFYDSVDDFNNFIANDKSAAEVNDIVTAYKNVAATQNPATLAALQTYYGIDLGGVTAAIMDPTKAQPILNAITNQGTTAAAAAAAGNTANLAGVTQVANSMGAGSLTYAQQTQGFGQAGVASQQVGTLSNIYGGVYGNYNQAQALQEAFGGPNAAQAAATRTALSTAEENAFGGSSGASTQAQSLGVTGSAGQL